MSLTRSSLSAIRGKAVVVAVAIATISLAMQAAPVEAAPAPSRIISLSPSATEILFGIGAGKQVIAVDDNSDLSLIHI